MGLRYKKTRPYQAGFWSLTQNQSTIYFGMVAFADADIGGLEFPPVRGALRLDILDETNRRFANWAIHHMFFLGRFIGETLFLCHNSISPLFQYDYSLSQISLP